MMHDLFDGSDADLIEEARAAFEADAKKYGFDLMRYRCAAPEPWSQYANEATGHRWGGWLAAIAAMGAPSNAISRAQIVLDKTA